MSKLSACPVCGKPSRAVAACNECRRVLPPPPCVGCGGVRPKRRKLCRPCSYLAMPRTECVGCGEQKRCIAHGMCATCYSGERRSKHGRKPERFSIVCAGCGKSAIVGSRNSTYCTFGCWSLYENGKGKIIEVYKRPRSWSGHVIPSKGGGFVAGRCAYCPTIFVASKGSRYCSKRCSANASWMRRYERIGEFYVSPRVRAEIYARDNHVCQLCFEPVDMTVPTHDRMGHTLDHIVPQSAVLVPDHSPANLRLAHRRCNSLRGDGSREVIYGSSCEALPELGRV